MPDQTDGDRNAWQRFFGFFAARARRMFTGTRAVRNLNRGAGAVMMGTGVAIATR